MPNRPIIVALIGRHLHQKQRVSSAFQVPYFPRIALPSLSRIQIATTWQSPYNGVRIVADQGEENEKWMIPGQFQRGRRESARGIYDDDLIDEVGYGLLARCESFIDANEARSGRARCPCCSSIVEHVLGLFGAFVKTFPSAQSPREKMRAIDRLIHGFHWFYKKRSSDDAPEGRPTRPVAVNLIEGRLSEVVAFLDQLTYGEGSTPGTKENYSQWNDKIEVTRDWYRSRRRENGPTE